MFQLERGGGLLTARCHVAMTVINGRVSNVFSAMLHDTNHILYAIFHKDSVYHFLAIINTQLIFCNICVLYPFHTGFSQCPYEIRLV
jgi:hypothetical protein